MVEIPVLDWQRFTGEDRDGFVAALSTACRETGFFLLSGHGVDAHLIERVFAEADRFFTLPDAAKQPCDIARSPHNRGWAATGSETLDPSSSQTDRKEAFNIGLDLPPEHPDVLAGAPFRGVNVWPDLPDFRDTMLDYYGAVLALGVDIHRAIALDLGLAEDHFASDFTAPLATLRVLHYPAGDPTTGIGAGAHTDYGSITLLMTDGEPGLQVRPRGEDWVDVPHIPGAFVVNIGDALMRWSNDIYVSTPHRVRVPRRQRRSVAFFLDPDPDTVLSALPGTGTPRHDPVDMATYLRQRLDATYKGDPA